MPIHHWLALNQHVTPSFTNPMPRERRKVMNKAGRKEQLGEFLFKKMLFISLAVPGLSCGVWDLVSWPGSNLGSLRWEHGVLGAGPPGKSPGWILEWKAELWHFAWVSGQDSASGRQQLDSSPLIRLCVSVKEMVTACRLMSLSFPEHPMSWDGIF